MPCRPTSPLWLRQQAVWGLAHQQLRCPCSGSRWVCSDWVGKAQWVLRLALSSTRGPAVSFLSACRTEVIATAELYQARVNFMILTMRRSPVIWGPHATGPCSMGLKFRRPVVWGTLAHRKVSSGRALPHTACVVRMWILSNVRVCSILKHVRVLLLQVAPGKQLGAKSTAGSTGDSLTHHAQTT